MTQSSNISLGESLISTLKVLVEISERSTFHNRTVNLIDALETLDRYGALAPILTEQESFKFVTKSKQNVKTKRNIALKLSRELGLSEEISKDAGPDENHRRAWFLGAGTTIAEFSNVVREQLKASRSESTLPLITNNTVIADALSCLMPFVKLVEGYSCRQYRATLPSIPEDASDAFMKLYGEEFDRFARQVQRCGKVVLTCTRFSLILGPFVRSVENAIAKRAVFHGATASPFAAIYIVMTYDKLIPIKTSTLGNPTEKLTSVFPVDATHLKQCVQRQSSREWKGVLKSIDERPRFGPDWHNVALTDQSNLTTTEKLLIHISEKVGFSHDKSWRKFNAPLTLIVGLPVEESDRTKAINTIERDVGLANEFFRAARQEGEYRLVYSAETNIGKTITTIKLQFKRA